MSKKSICLKQWEIPGILDGSKTLIVRPVTPQPPKLENITLRPIIQGKEIQFWGIWTTPICDADCRYQPGDVLLGRESWDCMPPDPDSSLWGIAYAADGFQRWIEMSPSFRPMLYSPARWRSPVTMPTEAARIKLAVSEVRVLRVQELTEEECMAIGIKNPANDGYNWGRFASQWDVDYLKCPKYEMNQWAIVAEIERMI